MNLYALAVRCLPFPPLENGRIIYYFGSLVDGAYPANTQVSFICDYPYRLSGSETDYCPTLGNWRGNDKTRTCNPGDYYYADTIFLVLER